MPDFRAAIENSRAHLFDGAIGTELYRRGVFINVCYDELNLKRPEVVREVHSAYRSAGADMYSKDLGIEAGTGNINLTNQSIIR